MYQYEGAQAAHCLASRVMGLFRYVRNASVLSPVVISTQCKSLFVVYPPHILKAMLAGPSRRVFVHVASQSSVRRLQSTAAAASPSTYKNILVEQAGASNQVALIRLNRPKAVCTATIARILIHADDDEPIS